MRRDERRRIQVHLKRSTREAASKGLKSQIISFFCRWRRGCSSSSSKNERWRAYEEKRPVHRAQTGQAFTDNHLGLKTHEKRERERERGRKSFEFPGQGKGSVGSLQKNRPREWPDTIASSERNRNRRRTKLSILRTRSRIGYEVGGSSRSMCR